MKIAELDNIQERQPYVGHVYSDHGDTPLHIVIGRGHKKWGKHRREVFYVTRCNRLISWIDRNNGLAGRRLCVRCGSRKDFEKVLDERYKHDVKFREEQNRKEDLDKAIRVAEFNWSKTWEAVDDSIVNDLELMVENGRVFIPFSKADLAYIRTVLKHRLHHLSTLDEPMYHLTAEAKRIQALLDDVLIY